jgi:hypothetical protein
MLQFLTRKRSKNHQAKRKKHEQLPSAKNRENKNPKCHEEQMTDVA